ncbi:MAG: hypothetical protein HY796_02090 [Elusimicrobia bacterium]|nr:hypothetical protein [Elusimicrobiota bacterium]
MTKVLSVIYPVKNPPRPRGTATAARRLISNGILPAMALWLLLSSRLFAGFDFTLNNLTVTFNNRAEFRTSTITINTGGVLNGGSSKISVSGNWSNLGAFNAGTSTVAFENGATTSAIIGNTTFYSFVCGAAGKTITFAANSTQTVINVFSVTGSAGNLIKLRSSADAVKWYIEFPNGPQTAGYVDVKDSNALLNSVAVSNFLNSGNNNANWVFGSPPALSWTGETNYTADGLNPETGDSATDFVYRVKYTDADNDAPLAGYPKLYIKKGGAEISGSPFTMNFVSSDTYITGAIYGYGKILTSNGTDYAYYFEAQDANGYQATGTPTTPVDAPDVANSAPTIDWTGETNYTADGLNPETGDRATSFVYRVKYTDVDNDAPGSGYPKVHIKKGGAEISESPFTMTYVSGANNTGAVYTYSKVLLSTGTDTPPTALTPKPAVP